MLTAPDASASLRVLLSPLLDSESELRASRMADQPRQFVDALSPDTRVWFPDKDKGWRAGHVTSSNVDGEQVNIGFVDEHGKVSPRSRRFSSQPLRRSRAYRQRPQAGANPPSRARQARRNRDKYLHRRGRAVSGEPGGARVLLACARSDDRWRGTGHSALQDAPACSCSGAQGPLTVISDASRPSRSSSERAARRGGASGARLRMSGS